MICVLIAQDTSLDAELKIFSENIRNSRFKNTVIKNIVLFTLAKSWSWCWKTASWIWS